MRKPLGSITSINEKQVEIHKKLAGEYTMQEGVMPIPSSKSQNTNSSTFYGNQPSSENQEEEKQRKLLAYLQTLNKKYSGCISEKPSLHN